MTEVISVRFRGGCKNYYFNPNGNQVKMGDQVIVETAQGPEFATCTEGNHEVEDSAIVKPLSPMLRMATDSDRRTVEQNKKRESEAFDICEKKIAAHGLEMKLVNVSASFDGNKIVFYFTADGRVDFRELVRDLAGVFRARIELRQIGVRDEAKMIGGLGICGRPFCCSQFLDGFLPVSIKMAKTQNLSLNPTKISGTCGRLMCCLKYEQEAYEDLIKTAPKMESFVDTPDGRGTVVEVNLLRQSVRVRMEDHPETIGSYKNTDIYILRSGKARKNDPPIPRDFAPISSKPRPVQKTEAFFEELPEVIYPDAVAVIEPEALDTAEAAGEEAGKSANRRRRRGGRRTKPAGERPQETAAPEKPAPAPKDQPRTDAPRRDRPKKERPPQQDKPDRKPAPQKQERPEKAEAADGQSKPRRRRRRSGGPRKPAGEGQPPKAE